MVTYINYSGAFDSISHTFMDQTLTNVAAKKKSRSIFRAIYSATTVRDHESEGHRRANGILTTI